MNAFYWWCCALQAAKKALKAAQLYIDAVPSFSHDLVILSSSIDDVQLQRLARQLQQLVTDASCRKLYDPDPIEYRVIPHDEHDRQTAVDAMNCTTEILVRVNELIDWWVSVACDMPIMAQYGHWHSYCWWLGCGLLNREVVPPSSDEVIGGFQGVNPHFLWFAQNLPDFLGVSPCFLPPLCPWTLKLSNIMPQKFKTRRLKSNVPKFLDGDENPSPHPPLHSSRGF